MSLMLVAQFEVNNEFWHIELILTSYHKLVVLNPLQIAILQALVTIVVLAEILVFCLG